LQGDWSSDVCSSDLTLRESLRLLIGLACRTTGVLLKQRVTVCKSDVSERVIRVLVRCLLELLHRFPEVLHSPLVPVITPSQIELISFWVTGIAFLQLLLFFTAKLCAQPLRYLPRDLLLHGECVANLAVVLLAPKLLVVAHVNQR